MPSLSIGTHDAPDPLGSCEVDWVGCLRTPLSFLQDGNLPCCDLGKGDCVFSLQAIIKGKIGSHVIYVHCYAHTLNPVLADPASVSIDVISMFSNLEKLNVLSSKSQKVHELFESVQKSAQLKVFFQ